MRERILLCVFFAFLRLQASLVISNSIGTNLTTIFDIKNSVTTQNQTYKLNFDTGAFRYHFDVSFVETYKFETKSVDNVTLGCYGWRDADDRWHITNYVADSHGWRTFSDIRGPIDVYPSYDEHLVRTFSEDLPQCIIFYIDEESPIKVITVKKPFDPLELQHHGTEHIPHVVEILKETPGNSITIRKATRPPTNIGNGHPIGPSSPSSVNQATKKPRTGGSSRITSRHPKTGSSKYPTHPDVDESHGPPPGPHVFSGIPGISHGSHKHTGAPSRPSDVPINFPGSSLYATGSPPELNESNRQPPHAQHSSQRPDGSSHGTPSYGIGFPPGPTGFSGNPTTDQGSAHGKDGPYNPQHTFSEPNGIPGYSSSGPPPDNRNYSPSVQGNKDKPLQSVPGTFSRPTSPSDTTSISHEPSGFGTGLPPGHDGSYRPLQPTGSSGGSSIAHGLALSTVSSHTPTGPSGSYTPQGGTQKPSQYGSDTTAVSSDFTVPAGPEILNHNINIPHKHPQPIPDTIPRPVTPSSLQFTSDKSPGSTSLSNISGSPPSGSTDSSGTSNIPHGSGTYTFSGPGTTQQSNIPGSSHQPSGTQVESGSTSSPIGPTGGSNIPQRPGTYTFSGPGTAEQSNIPGSLHQPSGPQVESGSTSGSIGASGTSKIPHGSETYTFSGPGTTQQSNIPGSLHQPSGPQVESGSTSGPIGASGTSKIPHGSGTYTFSGPGTTQQSNIPGSSHQPSGPQVESGSTSSPIGPTGGSNIPQRSGTYTFSGPGTTQQSNIPGSSHQPSGPQVESGSTSRPIGASGTSKIPHGSGTYTFSGPGTTQQSNIPGSSHQPSGPQVESGSTSRPIGPTGVSNIPHGSGTYTFSGPGTAEQGNIPGSTHQPSGPQVEYGSTSGPIGESGISKIPHGSGTYTFSGPGTTQQSNIPGSSHQPSGPQVESGSTSRPIGPTGVSNIPHGSGTYTFSGPGTAQQSNIPGSTQQPSGPQVEYGSTSRPIGPTGVSNIPHGSGTYTFSGPGTAQQSNIPGSTQQPSGPQVEYGSTSRPIGPTGVSNVPHVPAIVTYTPSGQGETQQYMNLVSGTPSKSSPSSNYIPEYSHELSSTPPSRPSLSTPTRYNPSSGGSIRVPGKYPIGSTPGDSLHPTPTGPSSIPDATLSSKYPSSGPQIASGTPSTVVGFPPHYSSTQSTVDRKYIPPGPTVGYTTPTPSNPIFEPPKDPNKRPGISGSVSYPTNTSYDVDNPSATPGSYSHTGYTERTPPARVDETITSSTPSPHDTPTLRVPTADYTLAKPTPSTSGPDNQYCSCTCPRN